MPTPLFQVDAFTDAPFGGNPVAVCLLEAARPAAWMQQVAREMNLSKPQPTQAATGWTCSCSSKTRKRCVLCSRI